MKYTLSAKEQSLAKIFSDDYVFSIPGYQRPYAWGVEQARELLDDLSSYMESGSGALDDMPPYFLGSIVLIKEEGQAEATVVDGQQRLTTLTLLLSAIRASVTTADMQTGITKRIYEHGDVVTATPARYRLSLRERDRDFFRQYVQHENGIRDLAKLNAKLPDAQDRMRTNARLFLGELEKRGQETLVRLVQFMATRCFLVTVATPDLDSAYRIFGVLNSRGLDLSATDILKAEIIGAIEPTKRDGYTAKWEGLEEDLGRESFGELFSHIRMVYRKAKPQGTLLKEFREHVGPADPVQFIDKVLMPIAQAFREITDADYSSQKNAEPINEALDWLNRIEFKDWLPPALAYFVRYRNQPESILRFVRDMERLAYSMLVRRTGVNERIERFSSLTRSIEADEDLFAESSPLQLSSAEQYQTYSGLAGPIYDTHSPRALSVILLRLDGLVSGGGATYDHDVITVEHVMPQQPRAGSAWLDWLPDPQERLDWVHRLGNLALLTRKKNSAANNFDFDKKKIAYFSKGGVSPFALTTQVLQHPAWTQEVMASRQAELLEKLEKYWRLEGRKSPQAAAVAKLAASSGAAPEFEMESPKHGLQARAREVGDQFIVLAGSTAKSYWTGSDHSYKVLHQQLIDAGDLAAVGGSQKMTFTRDVAFSSPSAAAGVILGRPDNGRTSWLLKDTGQTYAEWETGTAPGAAEPKLAEGMGERQQVLRRFWTQFLDRSKQKTPLFAKRSTTVDHWMSAGIGRTGYTLNVSLTQDIGRAEIYIRLAGDDGTRSIQAFQRLHARKAEIEAAFGGALDWQPLPGRSGSRICVEVPGGWKLPEQQWAPFQDRLIDLSARLVDAVRNPILAIDV